MNCHDFLMSLTDNKNTECKSLIIAAHPDDEVVGAGSCLNRIGKVFVAHVTDGSPKNLEFARRAGCLTQEQYADMRINEFYNAISLFGIDSKYCFRLGYTDQETYSHLTEMSFHFVELISEINPDIIYTHAYEGGHPDHDSTAFAVHNACHIIRRQNRKAPVVVEYASYHGINGNMVTYQFLRTYKMQTIWTRLLNTKETALKKKAINCFGSQMSMLNSFPLTIERFRVPPDYDFRIPPQNEKLFYEYFDWGVSGSVWRNCAYESLMKLKIK